MQLNDSLLQLTGVGPELERKFVKLGLKTIADLALYYPRRYDDYSKIMHIATMKPGPVTVQASITEAKGRYVRRGMHITEAIAQDDTGSIRLVWFNQPYREQALKRGQSYFISGLYELRRQRFCIMSPSVELVSDFPVNTARIVPIYKETAGLNSRLLRKSIRQIVPLIDSLPETLPPWIIAEQGFMSRAQAIRMMHFPPDSQKLEEARRRLGFEEVFELSLASLLNKREFKGEQAPAVPFEEKIAKAFVQHLPFTLTNAQRKVVWAIYQDMQKEHPMNRLVEGDVGSGKTVVGAMAAAMVLHHGHQVAFMAPTELLARQHAETLQALLEPLGYKDRVGLLVGSMDTAQKQRAHMAISDGSMGLVVGTHALIQEHVSMKELELIIIDEQHRFGVEQRKKLQAKAGHMPHVLTLTATPIPRSLALTLYGELDISLLDAKPVGRKPVITKLCSPNSRPQLYEQIKEELNASQQMFAVCPVITDTDDKKTTSVEKLYDTYRKKDFKEYRIGLLHGKMKADEKNQVMAQFVAHELDILVATTVIEVGVDVPNSSIMLIESVERFGLAQIHQLRGRVGRGSHQAYCFLMMSDSSAPTKRLRALETLHDGFKLAELDLELRGPGAIYGLSQHGALDLRVANLADIQLITAARDTARTCIERGEDLVQYKELFTRVTQLRAITNLN
jgi:ATP-dependent DNA helicase RecG